MPIDEEYIFDLNIYNKTTLFKFITTKQISMYNWFKQGTCVLEK